MQLHMISMQPSEKEWTPCKRELRSLGRPYTEGLYAVNKILFRPDLGSVQACLSIGKDPMSCRDGTLVRTYLGFFTVALFKY